MVHGSQQFLDEMDLLGKDIFQKKWQEISDISKIIERFDAHRKTAVADYTHQDKNLATVLSEDLKCLLLKGVVRATRACSNAAATSITLHYLQTKQDIFLNTNILAFLTAPTLKGFRGL